MRKSLLVDANSMVIRRGGDYLSGIGRTTFELMRALQHLENLPLDLTLLTRTIRGKLPPSINDFRHLNLPLPPGKPATWLLARTPFLDRIVPHDLLHVPHNYAEVHDLERTVVTIHDALYFTFPENFLGHEFAREHYPSLARACRAIMTCSESSKQDIVTYMDVPPEKVTVAHWGVNETVFYPSEKKDSFTILEDRNLARRPFYVSVSCDRGRKNTINVMRAYRLALQRNIEHDLTLVWGKPPEEYLKEFAPEINAGRIRMVSHVDDWILRLLYNAATVSWFPSKYEGFGLPVLESMACGTPVITCRNSSLAEAGGNAALYVDPDDVPGMVDLMIEFDRGRKGYEKLVGESLKHASHFTWDRTAKKYVEFYVANT